MNQTQDIAKVAKAPEDVYGANVCTINGKTISDQASGMYGKWYV